MKAMKKWMALGLSAMLALSLTACGGGTTGEEPALDDAETSSEAAPETEDAPAAEDAASSDEAAATEGRLAQIKQSGVLVMGCSADFPPYEFHILTDDGQDEITGYDVMLVKEIANDLGVELEIRDFAFDTLIGALSTGQLDVVASGMNANEERKKSVDFSTEYFKGEQVVIVRKEDLDTYKTPEAFKDKTVGAQSGSLQEEFANNQLQPHGATIHIVAKIPDLIMELKNGGIDGIVLDRPIGEAYVRANEADLAVSETPIDGDSSGFAIAVAKGNEDLLAEIDKTLARLEEEGKLDSFLVDAMDLAQSNEVE